MNRLSEVSFVIPVRIDAKERSRNLDLVIDFFLQHFDSHVIVLESDEKRRYFPKTTEKKLQYLFVEDQKKEFDHTGSLNRLYGMVNTPIIGVWDTDAIVPPHQIIETANWIRQGKTVMGLPYDGSAYYITEELVKSYQQTMDLMAFENKTLHLHKMNGRLSVGCAFMVDTVKYKQAGGENEHFTDWGPEDIERVKRVEILYDKPIYRSAGGVYHLWHPRNNSRYNDRQKEIMFKQELLKVCRMRQKELKEYVDSWPWKFNDRSSTVSDPIG